MKKPKSIPILYTVIVLVGAAALIYAYSNGSDQQVSEPGSETASGQSMMPESAPSPSQEPTEPSDGKFLPPMESYTDRVTKKRFGTFVEPGDSPVTPERFRGYHNAVDFEILPGEENADVPVRAICDGDLALKRTVSGYGGLVAQYCELQGEPVLVLYGHVRLSSVSYAVGDHVDAGADLAVLGTPGPETDNERKHLHLGIRRGHAISILGYVQRQPGLSTWVDPLTVIE